MMSFKCNKRCKIVFEHLTLGFNAVDTVFMRSVGVKYPYGSRAVCTYGCFLEGNDQDVSLLKHVQLL